ncbi:MAG: M23 family metallopeptidase [Gammaproteobacteria bacterium]|nr:M23 family metallopeptidase [Gammaproteobacteria bacterium]
MPLECEYGKNCFIQNYVDIDYTSAVKDYQCGKMTYDGHTGIDFRLIDIAQMEAGVNALAVADGVVTGIRKDDQTEFAYYNYRQFRNPATNPIDSKLACANKIEIKHSDGYRTQYCHLKPGSITLNVGDKVNVGDRIAKLGMSGNTEFPHLHIGVYNDNQKKNNNFTAIDPFTNLPVSANSPCNTQANRNTLWEQTVYNYLQYTTGKILSFHISDQKPDIISPLTKSLDAEKQKVFVDRARRGLAFREDKLTNTSNYIFLWAEFMAVKSGDIITYDVSSTSGNILSNTTTLSKDLAQYFSYIGKQLKTKIRSGQYTFTVSLKRNGTVISKETKTIDI